MTTVDEPSVAARSAILHRYARLGLGGKVKTCSSAEGKVIYSTEVDALNAADELHRIGCRRQTAYRCAQRRSPHWHTTSWTPPPEDR